MHLNVYLFEPEVTTFEGIFREGQLKPHGLYEEVPLKEPAPFEGRGYLLRNKESVPAWLDFFREHCEIRDPEEIVNRSNSFVLALETDGRIFAFTHGHGFMAIRRELTVPRFGLHIAVNAIDPEQVRSTESRNLRETATLKQLVLSRPGTLDQFEVRFNRELLNRLEGGLDPSFGIGTRIRGASSCGVSARVQFDQLEDWCRKLLQVEGRPTPPAMARTEWMRPVEEPALVKTLNGELEKALRSGKAETLYLSPADLRDYNQIETYLLTVDNEKRVAIGDLDIDLVLPYLRKTKVPLDEVRVIGMNPDGDEVSDHPLLALCVFETRQPNGRYVHTPDGWVFVNPSLVAWINQQLDLLARPPEGYVLPVWEADWDEGEYNKLVAENDPAKYFCLDKKLVKVEGKARIEVCDLLTPDGDLIHVKEYKSSSQAITHLVAQAEGSTDLLLNDEQYRQGIRGQLPKTWHQVVATDRISPRDYRIVLAVGAPSTRKVPGDLPFLSKQSLLAAVEAMTISGFEAFICPIERLKAGGEKATGSTRSKRRPPAA